MIQIEYLPIVLTGIGIIASILYYTSVLRNANKTRQTQIFMNLYEVYRSVEFRRLWYGTSSWSWTSYDDFMNKYGWETNPEAFSVLHSILGYFEGVGMLVKRGEIDIELVEDLLDFPAINLWNKFNFFVYGGRERQDWPELFANYEYLVNLINERRKNANR